MIDSSERSESECDQESCKVAIEIENSHLPSERKVVVVVTNKKVLCDILMQIGFAFAVLFLFASCMTNLLSYLILVQQKNSNNAWYFHLPAIACQIMIACFTFGFFLYDADEPQFEKNKQELIIDILYRSGKKIKAFVFKYQFAISNGLPFGICMFCGIVTLFVNIFGNDGSKVTLLNVNLSVSLVCAVWCLIANFLYQVCKPELQSA